MKFCCAFLALLASAAVQAHDGHGLAGAHWHATDTFGFVAGIGAALALIWWRGRK